MMTIETNPVDELKNLLIEKAKKSDLGIRFSQVNFGGHACESRVYFYTGEYPNNVCSKNVIVDFAWSQSRDAGTTKRCARFRAYSYANDWLNDYAEKK